MSDAPNTPKIACLPNGPYYLINDMTPEVVPNLRRGSGASCAAVRGVALCRCGGSKNKPFCDGTHGAIGFKDENTADFRRDKRVSYVESFDAGKACSGRDTPSTGYRPYAPPASSHASSPPSSGRTRV